MIHQMGQLRVLRKRVEVLSALCRVLCAMCHTLPLFNLRIRHSLGQSDTHSARQPVRQSFTRSVIQSVSLAVHTPENSCQTCVCGLLLLLCGVCAAVYDCNTFLRMVYEHLALATPPPQHFTLAVICGFLPACCCLAQSY